MDGTRNEQINELNKRTKLWGFPEKIQVADINSYMQMKTVSQSNKGDPDETTNQQETITYGMAGLLFMFTYWVWFLKILTLKIFTPYKTSTIV